MLTLYATPGSGNCFKPFLAMSQLAIPFNVCVVDVLSGETRSDLYKAINPAATVPYLRIAGGHGIGESNAMLWFIAHGSHLMPDGAFEYGRGLQWMFFEQSKLEPFISPARFFTAIVPDRAAGREAEIAAWRSRAEAGLAMLDQHLSGSDFIAGSRYCIADIGVFGYVHLAHEARIDMDAFPAVQRWIARVQATPRYRPIDELCVNAALSLTKAA